MAYQLKHIKKSWHEYVAVLYDEKREIEITNSDYRHLREILSEVYEVDIPKKSDLKLYGKDSIYEYYALKGSDLYLGVAERSKLGNDLFWEYNFFDLSRKFVQLRWTGYNDAFWWNNVAPTEQARMVNGSNGKRYRIDFQTRKVFELLEG